MYKGFFGMSEMPFSLAPDTQFFFCHKSQQEAMDMLLVGLQNEEGFMKITGEVGTGKTLLCRELLNKLDCNFVTAYIPNPYLSPIGLRRSLAEELGIETSGLTDHFLLKAINHKLIELNKLGKHVVVCLDEAQSMPDQTMEALRLLSNLETEKKKLLHIVLFGQPELDEKLSRKNNRQLLQRIVHSYHLQPLDLYRASCYIEHRLRVAGYNGEPLFKRDAIEWLFKASGGVPRIINLLSNKSLMLAFGKGQRSVDIKHVQAAIKDTESATLKAVFHEQKLPAAFFLGGSVLCLFGLLMMVLN